MRLYLADSERDIAPWEMAAHRMGVALEIRLFDDGLELYQAILADPPDLVVATILLATVSGPALCRLVKFQARFVNLPFYLSSRKGPFRSQGLVAAAGCNGFLEKPWESGELELLLQEYR